MDATLWILSGFALLYFVCIWERALSACRAKGYTIPRWLDAVVIVGLVLGEVGITGQLLGGGRLWTLSLWLWISVCGFLLVITASIEVWRRMTRQTTQVLQRAPSAIRAPALSEAEKQRLARLKRRSSAISIVGGVVFLACFGIGFGTLDLMSEGMPALNAGLIAAGPVLALVALVWTALLHRQIHRIEGNKTQETGSWWN